MTMMVLFKEIITQRYLHALLTTHYLFYSIDFVIISTEKFTI